MLSKLISSVAVRQTVARTSMLNRAMMVTVPQRGFLDRLGLEGHAGSEVALDGKAGEVSLW